MLKINVQSTVIPVEIGSHKFNFLTDDKSMELLKKKFLELEKKSKKTDELEDEKVEGELKEMLKSSFDSALGEGAFDKIYEETPATMYLVDYFVQLFEGVSLEVSKRRKDDKLNKYLNK